MTDRLSDPCTAFQGHDVLYGGLRLEVALAVKRAIAAGASEQILVFDDTTGRIVDLDLRGSDTEIAARLASPPPSPQGRFRSASSPVENIGPKGRGRPRLGVVSREVTLLPRHWDWLSAQPRGASAALRRLVDEARRHPGEEARQRGPREAAYSFMQALAGDLTGYEEAIRALFAGDRPTLKHHMAEWPADIRSYALRLAFGTKSTSPDESEASR